MVLAARLDIESLLTPISEEWPSGVEREYEATREEIAEFFREPPASVNTPAYRRPDPGKVKAVIAKIIAEGKLSHDVNLPVYYIRAGAGLGDLGIMIDGVLWLDGLITTFWESLHPTISEWGFETRTAPLAELTTPHGLLLNFDGMPASAHHRLGKFTLKDLREIGDLQTMAPRFADLQNALKDGGANALEESRGLLSQFGDRMRAVGEKLGQLADGHNSSPDLEMLFEHVSGYLRGFSQFVDVAAAEAEQDVAAAEAEQDVAAAEAEQDVATPDAEQNVEAREAGLPMQPQTRVGTADQCLTTGRADVIRQLDAIVDYYDRNEPGSPIPVALRQIRLWVNLDFLSLLREIAPDSILNAKLMLKSHKEESSDGKAESN